MDAAQIIVWGTKNMRFKITLAALAATVAFAAPAAAQVITDTEQAEARGTVLLPLSVTNDAPLDFGTVMASNTLSGSVTVSAEDGSRSTGGAGGVSLIALNPGGRGLFTVTATAGQLVDLTLAPPTGNVLNGPGGAQVAISDFHLDNTGANVLVDSRTMGAGGTLTVGVGGTFDIAAGQTNGVYTADFILTAEYN
jgi:hypothetical protein